MSSTSRISLTSDKQTIDKSKLMQSTQLQWPHNVQQSQQNALNVSNNFVVSYFLLSSFLILHIFDDHMKIISI